MKKSKYLKRLNDVNEYGTTVFDCIDVPMRRLCFELNRVGLQTHFSCCGFEYPNEKHPKSHIYSKKDGVYAYVMFSALNNKQSFHNLMLIRDYCIFNDFLNLKITNFNPIINLVINPAKVGFGFYSKELKLSIHDYEFVIVGISCIVEIIQQMGTVYDPVIFKDGNNYWQEIESWQVKPKPDFKISVDDFYAKYGKIEKLSYNNNSNFLKFKDLKCINLKD